MLLWHLLGWKSHLIIGQKSSKNARYYTRVLSKKINFPGRERCLEHFWHLLGSKSQQIISKNSKKMLAVYYEKNRLSRRRVGAGGGGGDLSICDSFFWSKSLLIISQKSRKYAFVTPFGNKITLDYRSKRSKKNGGLINITLDYQSKKSKRCFCDTFWGQNRTWLSVKIVEKCSILNARFK